MGSCSTERVTESRLALRCYHRALQVYRSRCQTSFLSELTAAGTHARIQFNVDDRTLNFYGMISARAIVQQSNHG